jgi:hypothetical protein
MAQPRLYKNQNKMATMIVHRTQTVDNPALKSHPIVYKSSRFRKYLTNLQPTCFLPLIEPTKLGLLQVDSRVGWNIRRSRSQTFKH